MPLVPAPSRIVPPSTPWHRTALRIARYAAALLVIGFCVTLLAVRYIVFPKLESNRDRVAQLLATEIGHPVEIDALQTGWDGWNPELDIRGFRILDRNDGSPLLALPELRLVVAWTSVLFVDLRLKELAIEHPQLVLSRDDKGMLHIAGMMLDPNANRGNDTRVADWLLRQPRIDIHDAHIEWRDDLRGAPPLVLDQVQFRLQSRFGRHRFGLHGTPPAELAAPLDLRGDVAGGSLRDWRTFSGRFYARLDYADVAAWREWLPLPVPLQSGKGAMRLWFEFADGVPREIVGDLVLADVRAKLGDDVPELSLTHLDGRMGWRQTGGHREFFTQQLEFAGPDRVRFDPTDFQLDLKDASAGTPASGQVEFNHLQLEPLRFVAGFLPLPERWRSEIARFKPRGTLKQVALHWDGEPDAATAFTASGQGIDLGVDAQDGLPGVTGFTGSFETTQLGGSIKVQSRGLTLQMPNVFAEPLKLDTAQGQLHWRREEQGIVVAVDRLAFANSDTAGTAEGEYRTQPAGPGRIDLTAQLKRADAQAVYRYIPLQVGPQRTRLASAQPHCRNVERYAHQDCGRPGRLSVSRRQEGTVPRYRQGAGRLARLR